MSGLQSPSFYSPATTAFGASTSSSPIPWVANFDQVPPSQQICVITADTTNNVAGLYVFLPSSLGGFKWKFALSFRDVCAVVANAMSFFVYANVTQSQSLDAGTLVWKNGQPQASLFIDTTPGAVWATATPVVAGQGNGNGGNAGLTLTNNPGDLPTPSVGDTIINLNNGASLASSIGTKALRSVGGVNLGLAINVVNA